MTWVVNECCNEFGNWSVFDQLGCEIFFMDQERAKFFCDEFNRREVYGKGLIDDVYAEVEDLWLESKGS